MAIEKFQQKDMQAEAGKREWEMRWDEKRERKEGSVPSQFTQHHHHTYHSKNTFYLIWDEVTCVCILVWETHFSCHGWWFFFLVGDHWSLQWSWWWWCQLTMYNIYLRKKLTPKRIRWETV